MFDFSVGGGVFPHLTSGGDDTPSSPQFDEETGMKPSHRAVSGSHTGMVLVQMIRDIDPVQLYQVNRFPVTQNCKDYKE